MAFPPTPSSFRGLAAPARLALFAIVLGLSPVARAEEAAAELSLDEPAADAPPAAAGDAPAGADAGGAAAASPDAGSPADGKTATDEGIDLTLQDRIKAVSRKVFLKAGRFELSPSMMFTVNDAFFRTWAFAGRGAWHINDSFAIEVGGGYVAPFLVQELETVDLLREQLALINADNKVFALADVGLTFSPVYGKIAVLGDGIINFDGFVSGGVGATFDTGADLVHPTMNVGVGARVFLTRWLVIRGDLRNYVYPQEKSQISTLQSLLFVGVGLGIYLPLDFDYQYEAARVNPNG